MARVDLTVMGGGIFGLSIAWEAARRGAAVRVIERGRIGSGASGGLVGALAPHVPEGWNAKKAFQLESLLMAEGWWAQVAQAGGLSGGYGRLGRLQPLADGAAVDLARVREGQARDLWQGRAAWRVVPVAQAAGWRLESGSGWMVADDLSARIAPRAALAALVAAIRARGGEVREEAQLAETAGPVIWATGVAGLADLGMGGGVKGQALALRFEARGLPQVFAGGLHIVPQGDGTVAIGSTSETSWQDPTGVDAQCDALLLRALQVLPELAGAPVVARWAGLRPRSASRAPLLGPWPGRAGHFIANGGFKIGFGMAARIAEVMVDLVLGGQDRIPPDFHT